MRFFLKNIGLWLIFIGLLWLIIPHYIYLQTNTSLLTGWILIVAGVVIYVVIKKKNL